MPRDLAQHPDRVGRDHDAARVLAQVARKPLHARREIQQLRNAWGRGVDAGLAQRIAHLLEIGVWAALFMFCGEFRAFATAYDHSAVNYTTLGYGNVIMSPSWRLLGPLEAANGMLMFGVSTAIIFTVIQRLLHARFADLRE